MIDQTSSGGQPVGRPGQHVPSLSHSAAGAIAAMDNNDNSDNSDDNLPPLETG